MASAVASSSTLPLQDLSSVVEQLNQSSTNNFNIHQLKSDFLNQALENMTSHPVDLNGRGGGKAGGKATWELVDPSDPSSMDEEVRVQKEYFRKLKFKYLEQEAKTEFLGSIMSEEPKSLGLDANEIVEKSNTIKKNALKAQKQEVESIRVEGLALGKSVAASHGELLKETAEATRLNREIREMELELARIRTQYPLSERTTTTLALSTLDSQIAQLQSLSTSLRTTSVDLDKTREEVGRTAKEVGRMGREKERVEAEVKEVRALEKGSEGGGGESGVDGLCRWYTAAIDLHQQLLGIKSLKATSPTSLQLEYIIPPSAPDGQSSTATLVLEFDQASGRFLDGHLLNNTTDIQEAVAIAQRRNDVKGLVADVLGRLRG